MSTRASDLHATADQQLSALIAVASSLDTASLRLPCPGREKLGDGTVGALIRHTNDNYKRIAGFVQGSGHGERGAARDSEAHGGHRYTADNADRGELLGQLAAARAALTRIRELTDEELDAIPPAGSFRFCDGQRTLEQVLAGLLTHQAHQLDALRVACARDGAGTG